MGYLTLRNIHIDTGTHTPHDISSAFIDRFDSQSLGLYSYVSKNSIPNGVLDFDGINYRPWNREIEDLKVFSKLFPDATITVNGIGEEPNDVWVRQYHAGHCLERHQIPSWTDWGKV